MRKFILITLLLLVLAACSNNEDSPSETNNNNSESNNSEQEIGSSEVPDVEEPPAPTPTPTLPPANPIATPTIPDHVYAVTPRLIHIVEYGDTMTTIANQYKVSIKALADANRIYNFDLIRVDDKIYIPPCIIDDSLITLGDLQN